MEPGSKRGRAAQRAAPRTRAGRPPRRHRLPATLRSQCITGRQGRTSASARGGPRGHPSSWRRGGRGPGGAARVFAGVRPRTTEAGSGGGGGGGALRAWGPTAVPGATRKGRPVRPGIRSGRGRDGSHGRWRGRRGGPGKRGRAAGARGWSAQPRGEAPGRTRGSGRSSVRASAAQGGRAPSLSPRADCASRGPRRPRFRRRRARSGSGAAAGEAGRRRSRTLATV